MYLPHSWVRTRTYSVPWYYLSYHCLSIVSCSRSFKTALSSWLLPVGQRLHRQSGVGTRRHKFWSLRSYLYSKKQTNIYCHSLSNRLRIINWLEERTRGKDEASMLLKRYQDEAEKGPGLRWGSEAFVSEAEMIWPTGLKFDHGEFAEELKQKEKSKAVKIKPKKTKHFQGWSFLKRLLWEVAWS